MWVIKTTERVRNRCRRKRDCIVDNTVLIVSRRVRFISEVWWNYCAPSNNPSLTITTVAEHLVEQNVLRVNLKKRFRARN
jgi:hypothetical protein